MPVFHSPLRSSGSLASLSRSGMRLSHHVGSLLYAFRSLGSSVRRLLTLTSSLVPRGRRRSEGVNRRRVTDTQPRNRRNGWIKEMLIASWLITSAPLHLHPAPRGGRNEKRLNIIYTLHKDHEVETAGGRY